MATIRASCPGCGDVELTVGQVRVSICSTNNQGSYAFQCPSCGNLVEKEASPRVVDVLVASGVAVAVWRLPLELEEPHTGPPICHDDLLAFHFDLESGNCLDELTGPGVRLQVSRAGR